MWEIVDREARDRQIRQRVAGRTCIPVVTLQVRRFDTRFSPLLALLFCTLNVYCWVFKLWPCEPSPFPTIHFRSLALSKRESRVLSKVQKILPKSIVCTFASELWITSYSILFCRCASVGVADEQASMSLRRHSPTGHCGGVIRREVGLKICGLDRHLLVHCLPSTKRTRAERWLGSNCKAPQSCWIGLQMIDRRCLVDPMLMIW